MRVPRDPARPQVAPTAWRPPSAGRSPAADGRILPFRRRTGLPVRRRSRLAALARPFLVAVAIVGIPAVSLWWSATSSRFELADLEVRGSERVGEGWVRNQLRHLLGRNLVWMPLGQVERTLAGHPWVAGAEVTKELPDRLRVVVVERLPAAILDAGGERSWLEAGGRVIAPLPADRRQPPELLTVRWDGAAEMEPARRAAVLAAALRATRELGETAPEWGRALSSVVVLGEEDLRFESRPGEGLPFPLLVRFGSGAGSGTGPEALAPRLRRLETLLPRIRSAMGAGLPEPATIDLRFRHRIVVRPAVAETAERKERGA